MSLVCQWFIAFCATLLFELPVFLGLTWGQLPWRRALLAGVAGSALTHPLLWFVWPEVVGQHGYTLYLVSGELLVAVVESVTFWLLARPVSWPRAVAASFLANGTSYALGAWLLSPG